LKCIRKGYRGLHVGRCSHPESRVSDFTLAQISRGYAEVWSGPDLLGRARLDPKRFEHFADDHVAELLDQLLAFLDRR
jgi:hypothetical protein